MSTQKDLVSKQNEVPVTPVVPTNHIDAAQTTITEIRGLVQQIPNFQFPASKKEAQRLVPTASVSPQFVELTNVAVANSVPLSRSGADPERLRDLRNFADGYAPLADELEAMAYALRHSVT